MSRFLAVIFTAMALCFSAPSAKLQYYVIEKVNKGTHFLKPGQEFAGFLNNASICGAVGTGMGAQACAVVTPEKDAEPETFYYLEEAYVTGTPAKNLVGFIEASIRKGKGIGGDKATGVFKVRKTL